jgi:hypothetical protein
VLNEAEARLWGGLLTAIGTAVMAAGIVRIFIPGADWSLYAASLGIGFGGPMFVAGWKWLGAEGRKLAVQIEGDKLRNQVVAAELAERAQPVFVPESDEEPADDRGWYLAIEITLLAGQVSSFTDDGLSAIMGSDARPKMQRFLASRGVLALRSSGYGWADGVTLADGLRRLRMGDLLPFPNEPAPEVRAPVQPATRRDAPRRAAKVVEGVARVSE